MSDLIPLRAAVAGRCTCPLHRACGSDQAGNTGDSEDRNTAHRSEGVEHVPNPEYSETYHEVLTAEPQPSLPRPGFTSFEGRFLVGCVILAIPEPSR